MNVLVQPADAARLSEAASRIVRAAMAAAEFGECDPDLAGECAVEVTSLEARTIIAGGGPKRVLAALGSARSGRPAAVAEEDLRALGRLEQVVRTFSDRVDAKAAEMDRTAAREPFARLEGIFSLASTAYGIVRTFL